MPDTKTILFIAHTPSPNLAALAKSFVDGVGQADCSNIKLVTEVPLQSNEEHLKNADAVILLTPENLGYMSGALKDWFDRVYYPCLEQTQGLPCTAIIRAGDDGTGTKRAIETITTGLKWRWVQEPLILKGEWQMVWLEQLEALGAAMAFGVSEGIF